MRTFSDYLKENMGRMKHFTYHAEDIAVRDPRSSDSEMLDVLEADMDCKYWIGESGHIDNIEISTSESLVILDQDDKELSKKDFTEEQYETIKKGIAEYVRKNHYNEVWEAK